jgi:hypothetical protein
MLFSLVRSRSDKLRISARKTAISCFMLSLSSDMEASFVGVFCSGVGVELHAATTPSAAKQ